MNKQKFQQLMEQLRQATGINANQLAEKLVSAAVIDLLQNERLYGEVLLQLPRAYDAQLTGIMGLRWQDNGLRLTINPLRLAKLQFSDELPTLLKHEVLHIVWQHPLRYRQTAHQHNVGIATDVAVNQYLLAAPVGTMTLGKLQPLLEESLPPKADSQRYLDIVERSGLNPDDQQPSDANAQLDRDVDADQSQAEPGDDTGQQADTHEGWESDQDGNESLQTANLQQLLTHAWQNTPDKQRGLLPGEVYQQLEAVDDEPRLNWRQLLKKSLGKMPLGKKDSYARFNRRQPLRMDLPGQITNLVVNVAVFVDNSGSMGEREISYLLTQIRAIMKVYDAKLTVYSFDTQVHVQEAYEVKQATQIRFERIGGGGTRFQSIFDFLHQQHATNNDTLTVILTDGWGEAKLEPYRFSNVLWVLTTERSELSVTNLQTRVASLADDPNYQKIKTTN